MYQSYQASTMKAFLSKTNVGVVSRYILKNPWIEIVSIDRIGEYWLMTLANLDRDTRSDIVSLIGFSYDHDHDHDRDREDEDGDGDGDDDNEGSA